MMDFSVVVLDRCGRELARETEATDLQTSSLRLEGILSEHGDAHTGFVLDSAGHVLVRMDVQDGDSRAPDLVIVFEDDEPESPLLAFEEHLLERMPRTVAELMRVAFAVSNEHRVRASVARGGAAPTELASAEERTKSALGHPYVRAMLHDYETALERAGVR